MGNRNEKDHGSDCDVQGRERPMFRKAEILFLDSVQLDPSVHLPHPMSRSRSGPRSSFNHIFMTWEDHVVRIPVSREPAEARLVKDGEVDTFSIIKEDEVLASGLEMVEAPIHAPGQAFISLRNRCIYDCAFCEIASSCTPAEEDGPDDLTPSQWVERIAPLVEEGRIRSIAVTSGVWPDDAATFVEILDVVRLSRARWPNIPIGVEPNPAEGPVLDILRSMGATEIKINVQCADPSIYPDICAGLDLPSVLHSLEAAVGTFGWGKVTSNIIIGLSSADSIRSMIDRLCSMGVVPTLRPLAVTDANRDRLERFVDPDHGPEQVIELSKYAAKALEKNGLTTRKFRTMCLACGGCDLVPLWDVGPGRGVEELP